METSISGFLKNESKSTPWHRWTVELLDSMGKVNVRNPNTWKSLELMAANTVAVRWLSEKLAAFLRNSTMTVNTGTLFYILVCYCKDNKALGFVTDRFTDFYRTHDRNGVMSCIYVLSVIISDDRHTHLNTLYNIMMACVQREYGYYKSTDHARDSMFSGNDFLKIGNLMPDFKCATFKGLVQMKYRDNMTVSQLAYECHMSQTVFRERFKEEFGISVSGWLRERKKERILSMLRNPDTSLFSIAESNGFKSASTFADYCTRNFGLSPAKLRKKVCSW